LLFFGILVDPNHRHWQSLYIWMCSHPLTHSLSLFNLIAFPPALHTSSYITYPIIVITTTHYITHCIRCVFPITGIITCLSFRSFIVCQLLLQPILSLDGIVWYTCCLVISELSSNNVGCCMYSIIHTQHSFKTWIIEISNKLSFSAFEKNKLCY
jgi:hypothetical protein